ncbi:hypothetical protein A6283_25805 [Bacillus wiedmannii]|nr:hypothetical protein A6283_25805 [Bacillus wiedmannii]OAK35772.1 hypothetical protein A6284_27085 [Bacillus wiedmannii]OAK37718.1 hypothetical protein A6285_26510 [Bacillus wiedmannii]PHB76715.1 hypothetical protein COE89_01835 [Bacillus wiedmannii]
MVAVWFWCKNFEVYENGLSNLEILIVLLYKRCVISMEKENLFKWKHYQPAVWINCLIGDSFRNP